MPSFPMMPPFREFGDRPGDATSAAFLGRANQEINAARSLGVHAPLTIVKGAHGDHIAVDRGTLDLRRFLVAGADDLVEGGSVLATAIGYDFASNTCTLQGEEFTVHAPAYGSRTPATVMRSGEYGVANFQPDAGRWEVVSNTAINTDDFFPARLDSHTGTSPIIYEWTEMEFTSETALATVLSGGRTGTLVPASWRATELNNNSVANNTIVWMKRGFVADPAVAVLTKTLAGNGAGTHATFSLYVDKATGGTYTITWDGETSAAIAFNASSATTKSAIQAITGGPTLSAFSGVGTLASPWTFSVTSDTNDHNASTDASTLKNGDGFRFDMGGASDFEPCLADPLPDATGSYKVVVQQTDDNCLALMDVSECTSPVFIDGGLTS